MGFVELIKGDKPSAVAVIHRFVENQGDAWSMTGAYLDRYVEEERLLTAEASVESDEKRAYLHRMRHVGQRVAELQLALASRADIPDFAPEPITAEDIRQWTDTVLKRANRAFDELSQRKPKLKEADRPLVDTLLSYREALPARLHGMLPGNIEAVKIRHHGDFHLGQMLVVKDDVFIIDFEGEPRRSLEDRRRKAPAARDVAGLIRSIDYSATAALERALRSAPDDSGKVARALGDWRTQSVAAVLAAYREFMVNPHLWPVDPSEAERLLDFFLLEKAFYEIEYELAHRPDWLHVPLTGILRILAPSPEGAA
jgi:maltose alpha-D-glucosyltransferase/alpha-amylase